MNNNKKILVLLPLAIAVSIVIGILIGNRFSNQKFISDNDRKLNTILNIIKEEYVDTVNINDLVEQSIPKILANLDPHSYYIPASELNAANGELEGSFSGIGISFTMMNDTVTVQEVISGGPSEKVGLLPGDRIVNVNGKSIIAISQDSVMKVLRGAKDSLVKLGIKRNNSRNIYTYTVKRGDIPLYTIDASYMIDKHVGYLKVNKFGKN